MAVIKPTTDWAGAPKALLITDYRHHQIVTDAALLPTLEGTARATGDFVIQSEAAWVALSKLPPFPTAGATVSPGVVADLTPILTALGNVPTALQNGAAARAAIVK